MFKELAVVVVVAAGVVRSLAFSIFEFSLLACFLSLGMSKSVFLLKICCG